MIDILLKKTGSGLKDFISSLVVGIQTSSDDLDTFYTGILVRTKYNAQKMVLQRALNEIFGLAADSIRIETNVNTVAAQYFKNTYEAFPKFFKNSAELAPQYFINDGEGVGSFSFTVKIPVGIYTAELDRQVSVEVSRLRVGGKTFNIITY